MPNIENLKKQAKQYLRWHRERYYPVAAGIRAALPRFQDFSDAQVLDADFKLADTHRNWWRGKEVSNPGGRSNQEPTP
jgi:hypothetical protein